LHDPIVSHGAAPRRRAGGLLNALLGGPDSGAPPNYFGYTLGMKTAVSIPDEVFEKVERFARRAKRSRSEVFSAALREYMARHAPDEVTEAINHALDEVGDQKDEFVAAAARRILERTEW
jgi:metal-responsive CopG/Arc/MetJ family transcriptional regulator